MSTERPLLRRVATLVATIVIVVAAGAILAGCDERGKRIYYDRGHTEIRLRESHHDYHDGRRLRRDHSGRRRHADRRGDVHGRLGGRGRRRH